MSDTADRAKERRAWFWTLLAAAIGSILTLLATFGATLFSSTVDADRAQAEFLRDQRISLYSSLVDQMVITERHLVQAAALADDASSATAAAEIHTLLESDQDALTTLGSKVDILSSPELRATAALSLKKYNNSVSNAAYAMDHIGAVPAANSGPIETYCLGRLYRPRLISASQFELGITKTLVAVEQPSDCPKSTNE